RPAGEGSDAPEWLREAPPGGTVREYVALDLRGFGPGTYTLRMVVEGEDGEVLSRELTGLTRQGAGAVTDALRRGPEIF
ncbi:MAG: hypothetical protein P8188_15160, partial [Gemmatimonadota bacterium]